MLNFYCNDFIKTLYINKLHILFLKYFVKQEYYVLHSTIFVFIFAAEKSLKDEGRE
jgi:thiaminase